MRIKQLKLTNIGSYAGEVVFSFHSNDTEKNIILIGGRNGAGKTTLFDSIRLCLYGYKLYGYRQNSQVYTSKIKRLINDEAKKNDLAVASINMQIIVEDGYTNSIFNIQRSWTLKGKTLKEEYFVLKDESLLDVEELQDFDNYLLQTIPPALFNFHFFNGENISEFLFDKVNGQTFRKAFMQLCGLDTLDLIEEQLQNYIQPQKDGDHIDTQTRYIEVKKEYVAATESMDKDMQEVEATQILIDSMEDQIVALDKKMENFGGIDNQEWKLYQEKLKAEELKREELRKFLKETANEVIPFVILRNELTELKRQIILETQLKNDKLLKEKLFNQNIRKDLSEGLRSYLKDSNRALDAEFFNILYEVMRENLEDRGSEWLKLSENDQIILLAKISEYMSFDIQKIKDAEKAIKVSLKKAKQIRSKIESKEIINSEDYLGEKNKLLMQLAEYNQKQYNLLLKQAQNESNFKIIGQKYHKALEQFKSELKAISVTNMSARTLLAFNELKENLYKKSIGLVENAFIDNFNRLISKSDLLDGIYISKAFEIVAYKNVDVDLEKILCQIEELGEEYMQELLGEQAWELVTENDTRSGIIKVPLKVEQHFSAGEQQIFVMALYQALTEIRTSELPFVIDTPLARIDSEHRKNILEHFFAKLPGQVIILSTDEEIEKEGMSVLQEKISDMYLIEHQIEGASTVKKNSYFKEAYN